MTRSITAMMLLVVLTLGISLTPAEQAHSQDHAAYLFISTSPMNADIIIDGSPQQR